MLRHRGFVVPSCVGCPPGGCGLSLGAQPATVERRHCMGGAGSGPKSWKPYPKGKGWIRIRLPQILWEIIRKLGGK